MSENKELYAGRRLAIACGGTGGHFYPGLSIARTFQANGGSVVLLLSGIHSENQKKIAENFGIRAVALPMMPQVRKAPFAFVKGLFGGYFTARKAMKSFNPEALLGMGSFTMAPVALAALLARKKLFLHDGNARIGKANRLLSRAAQAMGVAFPPVNGETVHCPVIETGMPVRPELLEKCHITKAEAVAKLNEKFHCRFAADKPVILIFGGSQGAAIFNRIIPEVLKGEFQEFQVLHLTGKGKLEECRQAYANAGFPKLLLESSEDMELFLGAADLVFCRAGGSTVAELALFGKAAVLIPYPYAAEGHQDDNARYFVSQGGAEMIGNSSFTVEAASKVISGFFAAPQQWQERGKASLNAAHPDAATKMLDVIFCGKY